MSDFSIIPPINSQSDVESRGAFDPNCILNSLTLYLISSFGDGLDFYQDRIPSGCNGVALSIVGAKAYSRKSVGFYDCRIKLSGRSGSGTDFWMNVHKLFLGFPTPLVKSDGVVFDHMEINEERGGQFFYEMYRGKRVARFEAELNVSIDLGQSVFSWANHQEIIPKSIKINPMATQAAVIRLLEIELDLVENESLFAQEIGRDALGGFALSLRGLENSSEPDIMEYQFTFFGRDVNSAKLYLTFQHLFELSARFECREVELIGQGMKVGISAIYPVGQAVFKTAGHGGELVLTGSVDLTVAVRVELLGSSKS